MKVILSAVFIMLLETYRNE